LYFNKTSGARNPGVPARGAFISGLLIQILHTFNFPTQSHVMRGTFGTIKPLLSYLYVEIKYILFLITIVIKIKYFY